MKHAAERESAAMPAEPFPSTLTLGESLYAKYELPSLGPSVEWESADMTLKRGTGGTTLEFDGEVDGQYAEVEIAAGSFAGLAVGLHLATLFAVSGVKRTAVGMGWIHFSDFGRSEGASHDMTMLAKLRTLVLAKTERGDVRKYVIADREVEAMSWDEAQHMLARYEERVSRRSKPRRAW